jgi:hypothetical protein
MRFISIPSRASPGLLSLPLSLSLSCSRRSAVFHYFQPAAFSFGFSPRMFPRQLPDYVPAAVFSSSRRCVSTSYLDS